MEPIKFTRNDDEGKSRTRYAHTPAEAVKLRYDGWTETDKPKANKATSAKASGDKSAN
jgi:hypothetical protein